MRCLEVLCALLILCGNSMGSQESQVTLRVHQEQRTNFLPGELIRITVELRNFSSEPIVEPWGSDWKVVVSDNDGVTLLDIAPLGGPRFPVSPEEGGSTEFSILEPGGSLLRPFSLQQRFLISDDGSYTVRFEVLLSHVVEEADGSKSIGTSFTIESLPFEFEVGSAPIVWQQSAEPLKFHVTDTNGVLSLRYFHAWTSSRSAAVLYSDYKIVGEVSELTPPPEVTDQDGRIGVKYKSPEGMVCAVAEVRGHEVLFTPPVLVDPASECPPTNE